MQIVWQNLASRNLLFQQSLGIALSQVLSDHVSCLVSVFACSTNLGQELLDFKVLTEVESVDTDLNDTSVVHRLGVVVAV